MKPEMETVRQECLHHRRKFTIFGPDVASGVDVVNVGTDPTRPSHELEVLDAVGVLNQKRYRCVDAFKAPRICLNRHSGSSAVGRLDRGHCECRLLQWRL